MSCSQIDLKAYFLGELAAAESGPAENHLRGCAACREELDRLRATRAALAALGDEEIPQRIAFVSDKVFAPRWWQALPRWLAAPASAALAVLLAMPLLRPTASPAVDTAAIEVRIQAEVSRRLDAALQKAVAEAEARQAAKLAAAVAATEKRLEFEHKADLLAVEENFTVLRKQMNRMFLASNEVGDAR